MVNYSEEADIRMLHYQVLPMLLCYKDVTLPSSANVVML